MSQFNKAPLSMKHPGFEGGRTKPAGAGGLWSHRGDFLVVPRPEDAVEEAAHGDACAVEGPQIHVGFW